MKIRLKRSDDVLQIQINEKAGLTYERGLKAILRHDPDIILVGEIRDEETAKIAIRASLTGHLVMTTRIRMMRKEQSFVSWIMV